jgi:hypothetical protein
MDLTDELARRPPSDPSLSIPIQTLKVTPDNVIELAVLFREAADTLRNEAQRAEIDLRLERPWLGDPISGWIWLFFNKYFVDAENSFAQVMLAAEREHRANYEALEKTAERYGLTEALNAELHKLLGR